MDLFIFYAVSDEWTKEFLLARTRNKRALTRSWHGLLHWIHGFLTAHLSANANANANPHAS